MAQRSGVAFDWWPFITDFQSAYSGEVGERSVRDVAKLKYLYMDCRRLAQQQGLTIRATTKLWDAKLASQALLFAKSEDRLWAFCDPLLAAFWRREFDLESATALETAIAAVGLNVDDWRTYCEARGPGDLAEAISRADALGVFGAPTFVWQNELFWGGDRLPLLAARLGQPVQPAP